MHGRPRLSAAAAVLLAALTGCSGGPDVEAAPGADDPACADLLDRLPTALDGAERLDLDVAGAAAWGDPPAVLRCGVDQPPPVGTCTTVDDVDWLVVEGGVEPGTQTTLVTVGRAPAVELVLPPSDQPPGDALVDLAGPVGAIPQEERC